MSMEGQVKAFYIEKGFGFITCQGQDIFYHLTSCGEFPAQKGDTVKFDIAPCPQKPGQTMAVNITGGTGGAYVNGKWVGLNVGGETEIGKIGNGSRQGIVKWFNKVNGWGFITEPATGIEHFVHIMDCVSRPVEGDMVAFDIGPVGPKKPNEMKAINVTGGTAPLDDGKGKGKGK
eukprot:gnl/TRDRNA2_/TRDRNA2_136829_c2_seq2.p1 gnl/TRDRNA2_/TRDRNA2_136829_c2~~gnl/TRDRNA2_/TRDRNA2_136829_c2_seq2.p1  ORF type:complete len:175 (-),score=26.93 gnl/TRDRNA2_/TRDRNA2_136829_c2_seq2:3-527(-)